MIIKKSNFRPSRSLEDGKEDAKQKLELDALEKFLDSLPKRVCLSYNEFVKISIPEDNTIIELDEFELTAEYENKFKKLEERIKSQK